MVVKEVTFDEAEGDVFVRAYQSRTELAEFTVVFNDEDHAKRVYERRNEIRKRIFTADVTMSRPKRRWMSAIMGKREYIIHVYVKYR